MAIPPLRHKVDARHIQNLGQNSVSDRHQAVLEIAKNSYDADAEVVKVTLHARTTMAGEQYIKIYKITFYDNGNGMTYEDLRDRWMRIATDSKVRETESPVKGRRVSGEKGMGRFSMQKLGQKVTIHTSPLMFEGRKTEYPGKVFKIVHDWKRYASNVNLSDIETEVTAYDAKDAPHYTQIEIEELNENWDVIQSGLRETKKAKGENDFEKLLRVLKSLVKPKEIFGKSDFKVIVAAEGFEHGTEEEVTTSLTEMAPYSITASLPAGNNPVAKCTIRRRKDIANKYAKSNPKFKYRNRPQTEELTAPTAEAICGKAQINIYYFPDTAKSWAPSGSPTKASVLDDMLKETCGIKIFNDGVRIMPYGEKEDDWMRLEARWVTRRSGKHGGHIRNNRIIGFVKLNRKGNPKIIETASRQKLEDNAEFLSLKEDFILPVLVKLETLVQEDRDEDREQEKKVRPAAKASSLEAELKKLLARTDLEGGERKEIEKLIGDLKQQVIVADKATEEAKDQLMERTELYRTVATFGLTALAYEHDINSALLRIGDKLKILSKARIKPKLGEDAVHLEDAVEYIKQALEWSQYSLTLVAQSSALRKQRRVELDIKCELENLGKQYRPLLEMHNLNFDHVVRGTLKGIYMSKGNWLSIFNNLMTNSIKALAGVERTKKKIRVMVEKTSTNLKIEWEDNGTGIAENDLENIFEMLWTNRSNKFNLSLGLGLSIVQEIMEDLDGKIEVKETVDDKENPGGGRTTFKIVIPLSSLEKNVGLHT